MDSQDCRCARLGLILIVAFAATATASAQSFRWPPMRTAADLQPVSQASESSASYAVPAKSAVTTAAYDSPQASLPQGDSAAPPAADPAMASVASAQSDWSPPPITGTEPAVRPSASGEGLTWQILENRNGKHLTVVFDPIRQVFAVYQVDAETGEIMLRSVRRLTADLSLPEYNSKNPAPKDVQMMLDETRR